MDEEPVDVIVHLKGFPATRCDASLIRRFLADVSIPPGAVHVIGGEHGQAFVELRSASEAANALRRSGEEFYGRRIESRLIDVRQRAEIILAVRDEGRPVVRAQAAEPMRSAPQETAVTNLETTEMQQNFIDECLIFDDRYSSPANAPWPNWQESTLEPVSSDACELRKVPLLPLPIGLFPAFGSPMPSSLLPLSRGGYWVKCEHVNPSWTNHQFDQLLRKVMNVKKEYFLEIMPDNRAYINFTDEGDYLNFLKRLGYMSDERTPKLDASYLLGMTASPCAECMYAYDAMAVTKRQRVYNGPGAVARAGARGGGKSFRGRKHWDHSNNRGRFQGGYQYRGRGRGGGHFRPKDQRNSEDLGPPDAPASPRKEAHVENTQAPPRKRFKQDESLAPNDLRFRLKDKSCSNKIDKIEVKKEVEEEGRDYGQSPKWKRSSGGNGSVKEEEPAEHGDRSESPTRHRNGNNGDAIPNRVLHSGRVVKLRNLPSHATLAEISNVVREAIGRAVVEDISSWKVSDGLEATIVFKCKEDAKQAETDLNGYRYKERQLAAVRLRGKSSVRS